MAAKETTINRQTRIIQTFAFTLFAFLIDVTSSVPLPRHSSTMTSGGWMIPSEGAEKSHLVMWMMTEKQLAPRIAGLADSATELLDVACQQEGMEMEDCLDFAASLPDITGVESVPSQQVLQSEKKKQFVKVLVENAYHSLEELKTLLEKYVFDDVLEDCDADQDPPRTCHTLRHFRRSLHSATRQYRDLMTTFYKLKPSAGDQEVEVDEDKFSGDSQLALKALHVAVNRLNQIGSVLEYSVEFSWFSRLGKGKRGGGRRKTNKKNNKVGQ